MLQLPPELTQITASACWRELGQAMRSEPSAVVVDAAALGRFDSAALAVLLALRREALKLKKTFVVQGLPQRLADLAGLYGISELLLAHADSPVK